MNPMMTKEMIISKRVNPESLLWIFSSADHMAELGRTCRNGDEVIRGIGCIRIISGFDTNREIGVILINILRG